MIHNKSASDDGRLSSFPICALLLTVLLLLTTFVYWWGLDGGFLFDDHPNIIENPKVLIDSYSPQKLVQATLAGHSGPLRRPVAMISFALDHAVHGLDPFYFKLTNLLIHLLAGIGVYYLSTSLMSAPWRRGRPSPSTKAPWIALAITAIWLLHPLNLSPVLYVVQRMTSLSALFVFWGLYFYTRGRLLQISGVSGTSSLAVGLLLFGALGLLSKENALLLPLLMGTIEWSLFRWEAKNSFDRRIVRSFTLVTAVLPTSAVILYLVIEPAWLTNSYTHRDFTMEQRILTEIRVLWFYIGLFFFPNPLRMGLFHDDFILSTGLLSPFSTLPAIIGLLLLVGVIFFLRARKPLLAFGLAFFFIGHLMESSFIALELVHEHRNYLPNFGLSIFLVTLGGEVLRNQRLQVVIVIGILVSLGTITLNRALTWSDNLQLALASVRHHPNSARSHLMAGYQFFQLGEVQEPNNRSELYRRARLHFERTQQLDQYNLAGHFALLVLDDRERRSVNQPMVESLAEILRHYPISAATINSIISLHKCERAGTCQIPDDVLNRLFHSILSNPLLTGWHAVLILTEAGQRAFSQGSPETAAFFLKKATEIYPNDPQVRLNYANVLISLNQFAEAETQINLAESADLDGYHSRKISTQRKILLGARAPNH